MKSNRSSNLSLIFLLLVLVVGFAYLWNVNDQPEPLVYSQVVQLFEQEKVESFRIEDTTLTMHLREKVNGSDTAVVELYDFDLFYDDLNDLVQDQYARGVLTSYQYYADHSTPWLELLLPYLIVALVLGLVWFFVLGRMNGGGGGDKMARFSSARVKTLQDRKGKVTIKDVAGAH